MLPTQRNRGAAFGTLLDMDRLVGSIFPEAMNGNTGVWLMPAEVVETEDGIRFDVELPGCGPDDVEVTLENNVLTITAEKKLQREEGRKDSDYRLFERRYGRFQRSFNVPPTVRGDECQARFENGVLMVRLPKAEEARPRRIRIEGGTTARQVDAG